MAADKGLVNPHGWRTEVPASFCIMLCTPCTSRAWAHRRNAAPHAPHAPHMPPCATRACATDRHAMYTINPAAGVPLPKKNSVCAAIMIKVALILLSMCVTAVTAVARARRSTRLPDNPPPSCHVTEPPSPPTRWVGQPGRCAHQPVETTDPNNGTAS